MRIAVFGLGYVGCVTATCLARDGHDVTGVDTQAMKVEMIQQGQSPVIEPGLPELIHRMVSIGRLKATTQPSQALASADLAIVCVGTPSKENGDLDLTYLERVCTDIGQALQEIPNYMVVVVRSTLLPGKAQGNLLPRLETISGKQAGKDFGFCVNPEFLREGSAIADFDQPPYTVIGQLDAKSGDQVARLYQHIDAPLFRVQLGAAEMIKYASNAFHALKVVFANEIGNFCQAYGVDSHQVMDVFIQDTKLNLSPSYLKPGFAFGGSCLGKDLRALLYAARQSDTRLPVLEAVLPSNQLQIDKVLQTLVGQNQRRIAIIGLSFKPNTDDLRESPAVELTERLIGKGFEVHIYDHEVSLSRLYGSNRVFLDRAIPHISSLLLPTLEETVASADAIVVTKRLSDVEYSALLKSLTADHMLIDLVRLDRDLSLTFKGTYCGISW